MDMLILSSAFGSFILFLILQMVVFRFTDNNEVMKWIVILFCIVGLLDGLYLVDKHFTDTFIFSLFIYALLTYLYVAGVLGIMVTSVRIQLLRLIRDWGIQGIEYKDITRQYNKKIIVTTRLDRLVGSKILVQDGKYFRLRKVMSPFIVYTNFHMILHRIYNPIKL